MQERNHDKLIEINMKRVKEQIALSVNEDTYIIQTISSIEELNKICNTLSKRLREWYGYYFPELEHRLSDNETFIKTILEKDKKTLMHENGFDVSMGPEIKDADRKAILNYATHINNMFNARNEMTDYLADVMKVYCPNIHELVGALTGAKLLEKAHSLRGLAMMPSSTIQLLGAEKALFRHLRNKKIRCPKHGFILSHSYVMNSKDKGKAARVLAGKISIAAKVDFFKGEFIADKLKEELEKEKK